MNVTRILTVLVLGLVGGSLACAGSQKTTKMTSSSLVPGAEGAIETRKGDSGNTELEVTVKHLAHPDKLSTGATTYVVWMQPAGQEQTQNIGALSVDKDLTGTLKTSTAHREFTLTITAEPFAQASSPAGPEVFSSTVRAK